MNTQNNKKSIKFLITAISGVMIIYLILLFFILPEFYDNTLHLIDVSFINSIFLVFGIACLFFSVFIVLFKRSLMNNGKAYKIFKKIQKNSVSQENNPYNILLVLSVLSIMIYTLGFMFNLILLQNGVDYPFYQKYLFFIIGFLLYLYTYPTNKMFDKLEEELDYVDDQQN